MKQILKYIYSQLFEYLKFAETKNSIAITLSSAVIVFAVTFISEQDMIVVYISSLSIALCLIAIVLSFLGITARHKNISHTDRHKKQYNLMYYKDILTFSIDSYSKTVKKDYHLPRGYEIDNQDLDLCKQIISTAKSVNSKFSYFNFSLLFIFLGVFFLTIAIIYIGARNGFNIG